MAAPKPIPAEVDFAARHWAGDWTEGLVPTVKRERTGWTFTNPEGERWAVVREDDGRYVVGHPGDGGFSIVLPLEPDGTFVIVHPWRPGVVRCRLDADGVITELDSTVE